MRAVRLHDTRVGMVVPLAPREPGRVGIYACGPTVYSRIHVGNARAFVVPSQLKRFLIHEGYDVTLVINVTDINDKIYTAALQAGVDSDQLARTMTRHYVDATSRLGLGRPDAEPLASETIGPIVDLIGDLIDRGHAYTADGDVYFAVRSLAAYGELSGSSVDAMDQGEDLQGAERKRDPLDFALWKAHKPGEDTAWDAPWGRGRPGWHIECSAMAESLLGLELDIHMGGVDLVFPHHENEAAQTLAARGRPLAQIWMHHGMIGLGGAEKMSKSEGNIRDLGGALDEAGPDTLLMYFSGGHYRQPVAYDLERLAEAAARVARVREAARKLEPGESPADLEPLNAAFFDALADDFNTARALGAAFEWIREANRRGEGVGGAHLREMLEVLGLGHLLDTPAERVPVEVTALAAQRADARRGRDFAEADRLRDELRTLGWEVRDGSAGPELVRVE